MDNINYIQIIYWAIIFIMLQFIDSQKLFIQILLLLIKKHVEQINS